MKCYILLFLLLNLFYVSFSQEIKSSFIIQIERLDGEFSSQVGEGLMFYNSDDCGVEAFYKADTTRDIFQIMACCNYEYLEEGISDLIATESLKENHKVYTPLNIPYNIDEYQFSFVNENSRYYFRAVPVIADYCECKSKGGLFYDMSLEKEEIIHLKSIEVLKSDCSKEFKKLEKHLKKLVKTNVLR